MKKAANNNKMIQKTKQAGFTLIELLIVVAILGLLAAIGIPKYQGYQAQAKINSTEGLHNMMVKMIGAELTKCNAGASELLTGSDEAAACSSAAADIATAFVTYGNDTSNSKNPYDTTEGAYFGTATNCAATNLGRTCVTAPDASTIRVTTYWTGDTQTADLTIE